METGLPLGVSAADSGGADSGGASSANSCSAVTALSAVLGGVSANSSSAVGTAGVLAKAGVPLKYVSAAAAGAAAGAAGPREKGSTLGTGTAGASFFLVFLGGILTVALLTGTLLYAFLAAISLKIGFWTNDPT